MRQLEPQETSAVGGGRIVRDFLFILGIAAGAGTAMQKYISDTGNPMLGAMSYGA
jgi:hypothetical protein